MVTEKIILNRPERFAKPHEISREKLIKAAEAACDKLEENTKKYGIAFPDTRSIEYKYVCGENRNWEAGMFTGCYWRAWELTGNKFFKETAEAHLETYKVRYEKQIGMNDHDVGFVFIPSCIAQYKITGSEEAKQAALDAAAYHIEHNYSKRGKFIIRMGGENGNSWKNGPGCRTMMDSLMNAPLFFWAGAQTGDEEFTKAGVDHNRTTVNCLLRDDASTFHHYQFDPETTAPVKGVTLQGRSDDSCWSRGHSWGIYGFPIAYSYCKEEFLLKAHKDISYFMLNHLPKDNIPYWDYDFVDGGQPRDSSAGVISACGMLEMCKYLPDDAEQKKVYQSAAAQLLEAVIDDCTGDIGKDYDGLICHVTHALPQKQGIDECAVYGDYFYLEALLRYLKPDWERHWA
jgi:unsaturated chondroitin disaccharide hydrolase